MTKQRVIVYVDGYNFYHGLKEVAKQDKSWKKFYWLDMVAFFEKMVSSANRELVRVNYFSALRTSNKNEAQRQETFFSANKQNPKFKLILGKYIKKDIKCRYCNTLNATFEEKETDVRIATQIINDVYKDKCDISAIVTGDSDIVPAIELAYEIKTSHKIFVYAPPFRYSKKLSQLCNKSEKLLQFKSRFNQSMLPESISLPDGTVLARPANWK